METLIMSNWSQTIAPLNALTAPNKLEYADRHGYEFLNVEMEYTSAGHIAFLRQFRAEMEERKTIMTIGCDTLFMNSSKKIEDAFSHGHRKFYFNPPEVLVAQEHIGWWPINNDVMIWRCTPFAKRLLDRIITDSAIWLEYPWLWQNHLWNMLQKESWVGERLDVVPAKEMNSTHQEGLGNWQLGDWIIHFLGYKNEDKIKLALEYLKYAGDGTFYPSEFFNKNVQPLADHAAAL